MSDPITVRYFRKYRNWGDALNAYLLPRLLPDRAVVGRGEHEAAAEDHLLAIGSIVHWATARSTVWGTGALRPDLGPAGRPGSVLAVRGPLTREVLRGLGVPCPERYGDPALLLPRFYRPAVAKSHRLGIVPHYVDAGHPLVSRLEGLGARVIDVFADTEAFVDEVCRCECILSSSLHGLICADAYGIPSRWVKLSDGVLGDGFKFRDYYASRGRSEGPLEPAGPEGLDELAGRCSPAGGVPDLDGLAAVLADHYGSTIGWN